MPALTPTEREYEAIRSKAVEIVDECIVGDVIYGLFRMKTNRYFFYITTSKGGSMRMGNNEAWARTHFAQWVAG